MYIQKKLSLLAVWESTPPPSLENSAKNYFFYLTCSAWLPERVPSAGRGTHKQGQDQRNTQNRKGTDFLYVHVLDFSFSCASTGFTTKNQFLS